MARPTKLDHDLQEQLCNLIRRGNYLETAAAACGIAKSTVYRWQQRGEDEIYRLENDAEPDPDEAPFLEFCYAVKKARAQAENRNVQIIQAAAQDGNWQAAAWWNERTAPQRWGRHERLELTGADGGSIQVRAEAEQSLVSLFAGMEQRALEAIEARREGD